MFVDMYHYCNIILPWQLKKVRVNKIIVVARYHSSSVAVGKMQDSPNHVLYDLYHILISYHHMHSWSKGKEM